jgi:hypothetical protein
MEPDDDENGEESLFFMLYRSCFMILKYSSSDFAWARRAKT